MTASNKISVVGIVLASLLLLLQLLFQYRFITLIFIILLFLLVTIAFLKEENRAFVWTIVAFSGGMFAFVYGDRLILELPLSYSAKLLLNRGLLLIPIVAVFYVMVKFGQKPLFYPITGKKMGFGRGWINRIYQVFLGLLVVALLFFISEAYPFHMKDLWVALLYSFISAVLMEILWRGVLLLQLKRIVGSTLAVFVTALSSALAYYLFGYSFLFCTIFFLSGILLGAATDKTNRLLPAILSHFLLTFMYMIS